MLPPRIILTGRSSADWNIRLTGVTICALFRVPFFATFVVCQEGLDLKTPEPSV